MGAHHHFASALSPVGQIQIERMPEAQCLAVLEVMSPFVKHVSMACLGPEGEVVEFRQ